MQSFVRLACWATSTAFVFAASPVLPAKHSAIGDTSSNEATKTSFLRATSSIASNAQEHEVQLHNKAIKHNSTAELNSTLGRRLGGRQDGNVTVAAAAAKGNASDEPTVKDIADVLAKRRHKWDEDWPKPQGYKEESAKQTATTDAKDDAKKDEAAVDKKDGHAEQKVGNANKKSSATTKDEPAKAQQPAPAATAPSTPPQPPVALPPTPCPPSSPKVPLVSDIPEGPPSATISSNPESLTAKGKLPIGEGAYQNPKAVEERTLDKNKDCERWDGKGCYGFRGDLMDGHAYNGHADRR